MSSKTNYTQGYSQATQATHASRTVDSDASFLVPHIRPTDHILDVGCGPGTITVGFAGLISSQGSVTGVDISETVLEKAKQAVASSSIVTEGKQVTFLQADLLSHDGLPLKDATFDVVFTSQLFPHLSTHDMRIQALAEMRRVLKPGGILATRDAAHLHFYPQPPAVPARQGQIGAGTTAYTDEKARRWFAEASKARLERGETFRQSWLEVGITDQEIEDTKVAWIYGRLWTGRGMLLSRLTFWGGSDHFEEDSCSLLVHSFLKEALEIHVLRDLQDETEFQLGNG